MKFKDVTSLGIFLKSIKTNDQPDLEKIKKVTKSLGVISHRDHYYFTIMKEETSKNEATAREGSFDDIGQYLTPEDDSIRLSPIADPQLASILNEKQEIQFGDDYIFRVQNDYTFHFRVADDILIGDYYKALKNGTIEKPVGVIGVAFGELTVYKTLVKTISLENQTDRSKNGRADAYCGLFFRDDVKMEGKLYSTWSFFYSSGAIETKVIKRIRTCSFWRCKTTWDNPQTVARLAMNFDIYVSLQGAIATRFTRLIILTNTDSNNFFLGDLTGANVSRFDFSGWSCHSATYAGSTLTCSNTFYDLTFHPYTPLVCP